MRYRFIFTDTLKPNLSHSLESTFVVDMSLYHTQDLLFYGAYTLIMKTLLIETFFKYCKTSGTDSIQEHVASLLSRDDCSDVVFDQICLDTKDLTWTLASVSSVILPQCTSNRQPLSTPTYTPHLHTHALREDVKKAAADENAHRPYCLVHLCSYSTRKCRWLDSDSMCVDM